MNSQQLHVVFGTGPLGLALMRALRTRNHRVRMINRSARVRFDKDVSTEVGGGDAANPTFTREVCDGAIAVYHCIGLPYPQWPQFPSIMHGIIEGAAAHGAPLIYGDNLYMYGAAKSPMSENAPIAPCSTKGHIRAEVADILFSAQSAGKLRVAAARGSDFFGPGVTEASMLGSRVFARMLAGKSAQMVGNPDKLHSYTFVDDFGAALALIGERPDALGRVWLVPTAPAMTTRAIVEHIARRLSQPPKIAAIGSFMLSLGGFFDKNIKEAKEMLYEFEDDFIIDSSSFEKTFGVTPTPMHESLNQTLEWFRNRPRVP